jgi:hypothetical protein
MTLLAILNPPWFSLVVLIACRFVRDENVAVEQQQLGVREFASADAIFHDEDEERDGENTGQCYAHVDQERYVAPSNGPRPHSKSVFVSAPRLFNHYGSTKSEGQEVIED